MLDDGVAGGDGEPTDAEDLSLEVRVRVGEQKLVSQGRWVVRTSEARDVLATRSQATEAPWPTAKLAAPR